MCLPEGLIFTHNAIVSKSQIEKRTIPLILERQENILHSQSWHQMTRQDTALRRMNTENQVNLFSVWVPKIIRSRNLMIASTHTANW